MVEMNSFPGQSTEKNITRAERWPMVPAGTPNDGFPEHWQPIDEPPPYIPPPSAPSVHALIPDTPLVESPTAAFDDDAPLWQS